MELQNWSGNVRYRASVLERPTSLAELQDLVARAPHIRALGSRHSFSDIADTAGALVDVSGVPLDIEVDAAVRRAWVPGAARYAQIAIALEAAGLALRNMGSLPHISLAGAMATGTHGSGDRNRILGASVTAIEYVGADGDLVTVRDDDPSFEGRVVGLGGLGIVTRVELDVVPTFDVRQDIFLRAPWTAVLDAFDQVTSSAYSVSLFIADWGTDVVDQLWLKSVVTDDSPTPELPLGVPGARATVITGPLAAASTDTLTDQIGSVGRWLDRLPHFRHDAPPSNAGEELQSEFFVARTDAVAAIGALRSLAEPLASVLLVSEIRTVAADELWMSGAYGRDTVGLHFTWRNDLSGVRAVLPLVEAALAPFDPRPHWGKLTVADRSTLLALYPRGADFRDLVEASDPHGKFGNDYLAELFG